MTTFTFTDAGDIDFEWDYEGCWDEACIAFMIDHPDWFYTGYYYQDGEWNGYPHFTDGMGAHLYWYESGDGGWWQFDNREQDGTNDWYDGGYLWCDSWDNCGGEEDWEEYGYVTHDFNGAGAVTFTPSECNGALNAVRAERAENASYSATTIVSGMIIAAASIAGLRHISKQNAGDNYA